MKNTYQFLSDDELVHQCKTSTDSEVSEFFIKKHLLILQKLAHNHTKRFTFTQYEDNLQNAKIGMLEAIQRYKPGMDAKFSTFLYKTVYYYLLSQNDNEAFVKCPPRLREIRSYYGGKYNDVKNKEIENKYDLKNSNYVILSPEAFVVTDEFESKDEYDCFDRLAFWDLEKKINEEEKQIVNLLIEDYNVREIVSIMSESNKKSYTPKIIRKKIQNIRECFNV